MSHAPERIYVCVSPYCREVHYSPGLCSSRSDYRRHHDDRTAPLVKYVRADGGGQLCFVCMQVNDGREEFTPLVRRQLIESARWGNNGVHLCPRHRDFERGITAREHPGRLTPTDQEV